MSHKRSKVEGAAGVQLSLIITPMLDMSFQILAFFIMTYHPSALEGHIPGSLVPPEEVAKKSKDNNTPAPVDPLSLPEDLLDPTLNQAVTVYVKSKMKDDEPKWLAEGAPIQIFTKSAVETDKQELPVKPAEFEKFDDVLAKLEVKLKELGAGSKANLKIAADGGTRYQHILKVYDAAKRAGFEKIHFVPPALTKTKIR